MGWLAKSRVDAAPHLPGEDLGSGSDPELSSSMSPGDSPVPRVQKHKHDTQIEIQQAGEKDEDYDPSPKSQVDC